MRPSQKPVQSDLTLFMSKGCQNAQKRLVRPWRRFRAISRFVPILRDMLDIKHPDFGGMYATSHKLIERGDFTRVLHQQNV